MLLWTEPLCSTIPRSSTFPKWKGTENACSLEIASFFFFFLWTMMSIQAALCTWTPLKLPTDLWKFLLLSQPSLPFKKGDPIVCWSWLLYFTSLLPDTCPPPYCNSDCYSKGSWQELPLHGIENCNHWHNSGQPKIKKGLFLQLETTKN